MSKPAEIMLVQPFRDTSDVIRTALGELGFHNMVTMEDAEAALASLLEHGSYRLVIADWSGGGLSLLQEMRARKNLNTTPVLLMAAGASKEMVVSAKTAGATDFIMKPFSIATFKRKVGMALNLSKPVNVIDAVA
jgi:two-component system, chemotaxis family, chemotaxis protein CheY